MAIVKSYELAIFGWITAFKYSGFTENVLWALKNVPYFNPLEEPWKNVINKKLLLFIILIDQL
jgi:hypothetical protein